MSILGTTKLGLIGGGIIAAGGYAGYKSYQKHTDEEITERAPHALADFGGTAIFATGVVGAGYLATRGIKPKMPGMPKILNSTEPITVAGLKSFAKKPLVMAGGLAAVGGIVGSQIDKEHPVEGAAVGVAGGAVAGAAIHYGLKGKNLWKKIGPLGRGAAIGALALTVAGVAHTNREPSYESSDMAVPDGYGDSYNMSASGVKNRLTTMNAQGDVVLGLNRKRR
ncbi:unnamed protein product [Sphagnum jensenii]|uniref:Glycine zipper 2TM domain-containing protein n=1 Tax=Sphagnum jensenii TaxID=128206 RepID=A0ABP0V5D2_9BRYO